MDKNSVYRYVLIYNGPEKANEDLLIKYIDYIMQTPNFLDVDLEYEIGMNEVSTFFTPNTIKNKGDLWKINSVFSGTYKMDYARKGCLLYPSKFNKPQISNVLEDNITFAAAVFMVFSQML